MLVDSASRNSREEAQSTLALMTRNGWSRVLVVSDPPHMRRLSWTWSRVFSGSGKTFRLVVSAPADWNASRWWADEKNAQGVLMETIKLGYYLIKY